MILRILFRTSGGSAKNRELGTGHIFRTINLSKKFEKDKKIFLIEDYGGVKKILQNNNISNIKFLKPDLSAKNFLIFTQNGSPEPWTDN